jgi:hypothetical protein
LTQEVAALRYGPHMHAYATVLGAGLGKAQRAMLGLAMSFPAWRSLVIDGGLKPADAARAMARAVVDAAT